MLDVHILDYKSVKEYLDQCIASVEEAAKNCDFSVAIHVVNGEPHLGKSRAKGFRQGSFPFVTYVDNDDYVLSNAFAVLGEYLRDGVSAVFTREQRLYPDGSIKPNLANRHNMSVYNRAELIDHSEHIINGDVVQRASVADKNVIDILEPVYVHRVWNSPCSQFRKHLFTNL